MCIRDRYDPVECEIITIENYEKRIPIARENFIRAEKEEQITLLEGDAKDVLETLTEPFDLIFMDAAKGQYLNFLPRVLELLQPCLLYTSCLIHDRKAWCQH